MSNHTELKVAGNPNELDNLTEKAIAKYCYECYEYRHFSHIQEMCSGVFGKVYRANWNISNRYLALKSFFNLNNATVKEIIYEVIII